MLKKTITYEDFDGVERTEDFYFNLSKSELITKEMTTDGGLTTKLQKIVDAKNAPEIMDTFRAIILSAYGERTPDGRGFIKVRNGVHLSEAFEQTAAYDNLFYELVTDDEAAQAFVKGIIPADIQKEMAANPNAIEMHR